MDTGTGAGVLFGMGAGILLGTFALPMKAIRLWRWENTWLVYCFWALLVLPWALALFTVPSLLKVIGSVSAGSLMLIFFFGFGWGIACVFFGLGLRFAGLAVGTAIVLGLNNAVGSILPLLLAHRFETVTPSVRTLVAGVAIMLLGVILCSWAASQKESNSSGEASEDNPHRTEGILMCIASGVIGPSFNLALIYGGDLSTASLHAGASTLNANNAVWCVSLLGGFVPNFAYCAYLLCKNSTWLLFKSDRAKLDWSLAFAMGLTWMSGVGIYGVAVQRLGKLGASVGWALIQSTAIIGGNMAGFITGEWRGSSVRSRKIMAAGLAVVIVGIMVVGWSAIL